MSFSSVEMLRIGHQLRDWHFVHEKRGTSWCMMSTQQNPTAKWNSQWLWYFSLAIAHFADELMRQEQEQARLNEARKISIVNVNPTNIRPHSDTPEIRKYKKRFNSEILCAALWGESKAGLSTFFLLYTQHLFLIESSINAFISLQIHYDLQIVLNLVFDRCRCEPAGRNRKWTHVTRSQWSGQSL